MLNRAECHWFTLYNTSFTFNTSVLGVGGSCYSTVDMEAHCQSVGYNRDTVSTMFAGEHRLKLQSTQRHRQNGGHVELDMAGRGLNVLSAAVLLAGMMTGGALLALPKAVVDCGWIGFILLLFLGVNAAYCGTLLGVCWTILEERYPEYTKPVRNPFATIAHRAVGKWGRRFVSLCLQLSTFGTATVVLLVASETLQELLQELMPRVTYCMWIVVLAACLCPAMWLGSPKDFRFAGFGALVTTALAAVFILIQIISDGSNADEPVNHKRHDFSSLFLGFGTIVYVFGGTTVFPTIQNDMSDKKQFPVSVLMGFSMILVLAIPVSTAGFLVYGDTVNSNIILSLRKTTLVNLANILTAIHLISAFLIIVNPMSQELEHFFNVPPRFSWQRVLVRSTTLCAMVLIGETVPNFGTMLALVGGSMGAMLTLVLPSFFYIRLCDQQDSRWTPRVIPMFERIYLWELILIGLVGGTAATYIAFLQVFSEQTQTVPCYWGL